MTEVSYSNIVGKNFLVTGGTGYIGSHFLTLVLQNGGNVVVVDDLSNSSKEVLERIKMIVGAKFTNLKFYQIDMVEFDQLEEVFKQHRFDGVIHFAGKKAVGESLELPLLYYEKNIEGTLNLLRLMSKYNCKKIVFSSSATVYGVPKSVPIDETFPISAINPYGKTKLFIEEILKDVSVADKEFKVVLLRYFNPVGAHPSGLIGEHPKGIPNNMMPYIQQVAVGIRPELKVFGGDYPSRDGTCIRDYIHVLDLVEGHIVAIDKLMKAEDVRCEVYNLGTGKGTTVLELADAFENASKVTIKRSIVGRRHGDTVEVWADPSKAKKELGW